MKKLFTVLLLSVIMFSLLSGLSQSVSAMKKDDAGNAFETEGNAEELDIKGDYHFFFQSQDIEASVIKGNVSGDIIAASSNIDIQANVGGNIRAAAMELNINSPSVKNITVFASILNIDSACVSNAVYAAGGTVTYKGKSEYVKITAATIYLYGKINGNAVIEADNVYISSECDFSKLLIKSSTEPKIFTGDDYYNGVSYTSNNDFASKITFEKQKSALIQKIESLQLKLPMQMILVCLFCLLFAKTIDNSAEYFRTKKGNIFGYGAVGMFGIPVIALILIIFVYTIYVSAILALVYLLIALISMSFTSASVSRLMMPKVNKYLSSLIVVTGAVLLSLIPVVSAFITVFTLIYTFGYFLSCIFKKKQEPQDIQLNDISM